MKSSKVSLAKRRGITIPLVLAFASILLLYLAVYLKLSSENKNLIQAGVSILQARLMAMSGVQHLLLKVKLMPTELYDAWALARGRNPLFNFGDGPASADNPGPRFVTRGVIGANPKLDCSIAPEDDFTADPGGWFNNCAFSSNVWPRYKGAPIPNSQLYLWKFCADITNNANIQPALALKNSPPEPFTGWYEVADLKVLGQKDLKGYEEDTIGIEVIGTIKDLKGKITSQSITRKIWIKRR